jgi:hypothetical protein
MNPAALSYIQLVLALIPLIEQVGGNIVLMYESTLNNLQHLGPDGKPTAAQWADLHAQFGAVLQHIDNPARPTPPVPAPPAA